MLAPRQLKRKKLLLIILIIILVISAAGFFGYKVFTENKITKFDVKTENLNCTTSQEIVKKLHSLNLNYFYYESKSLENNLKKQFLCIGKIESEIAYPDKLKLKLAGRDAKFIVTSIKPTAQTNPQIVLSLEQMDATQSTTEAFPPKVLNQILDTYRQASDSAMYLVDEEGMVFEEITSNVNFPRVSIFSQDLRIGQKIPDDLIKKVTQVTDELKEIGVSSDNLIIVGDKLIIDWTPRITFALNRPLDRQSASLQLILAQAKINLDPEGRGSKFVESIDLRFDKPVVVYEKNNQYNK